jgi:hypothetical protein
MKKMKFACAPVILSILAGCGGGGGSVRESGQNIREFTSWSAVEPGTTFRMSALTREAGYTMDTHSGTVTSLDSPSAPSTGSTLTWTLDANYNTTGLAIQAANSSVSLSTAAGDTRGIVLGHPSLLVMSNSDASKMIVASAPYDAGWDYQGFGLWNTENSMGVGTVGVMSAGVPTAGAAIPASGTATYSGAAAGYYVEPSGNNVLLVWSDSNLSVGADFGARTLAFATTQTAIIQDPSSPTVPAPDLNLTGTLTYAAGSNSFTGPVSSAGGLSGTADGRFYGPAAEELGGVFALNRGSGLETYTGAFGGKRGAISATP